MNRAYTADGLNRYSAAGSASFTYDAGGNLATSPGPGTGETLTFAYDSENRLTGRTSNGASPTVTLGYDPLGRLWQVTSGSNTTRFLWDGWTLVAEYNGSGTLTERYVHGGGIDNPTFWYHGSSVGISNRRQLFADPLGSVVAITDGYGARTNVNSYDEYGIPASGNTGRFQYTGLPWLGELGMQYSRNRIYSPSMGRFMQTDPIGVAGGINLYGYVRNDPVNLRDPSGLTPPPPPEPEDPEQEVEVNGRRLCGEGYARLFNVCIPDNLHLLELIPLDGYFSFTLSGPVDPGDSGCTVMGSTVSCALPNENDPEYCSSLLYQVGDAIDNLGRSGQRVTAMFTIAAALARAPLAAQHGLRVYGYLGMARTLGGALEILGGRPVTGWELVQELGIRVSGLDAMGQMVTDITFGAITAEFRPAEPC